MDNIIIKCPKCDGLMEKKLGKHGYFWGCRNFKRKGCRGTKEISLIPFEFEYIDYEGFLNNNPTQYLLKLIDEEPFPEYVKELKYELQNNEIKKGTIYKRNIEGKISGVFDYLRRNGQFFNIAKLAYWFYILDGDLQGKIDYWLNRKPKDEFRKEHHIKKALVDNWHLTPFDFKGYMFYSEEYHIGEWEGDFGGYIVDLVAESIFTDELIFIEVKGLNVKGKKAMEQVLNYVRYYNKIHSTSKIKKAYIVCKGYPRGIFDDDIDIDLGIIGYVIENDKISFIPWKLV